MVPKTQDCLQSYQLGGKLGEAFAEKQVLEAHLAGEEGTPGPIKVCTCSVAFRALLLLHMNHRYSNQRNRLFLSLCCLYSVTNLSLHIKENANCSPGWTWHRIIFLIMAMTVRSPHLPILS